MTRARSSLLVLALPLLLVGCEARYHFFGDGWAKLDSSDTGVADSQGGDDTVSGDDSADTTGPDDSPTDTGPKVDDEYWSGVTLTITAPGSGEFLPYEEPIHFEAALTDADGLAADFEDVTWTSNVNDTWTPSGLSFDDDTIGVGQHDITAKAELPNGDRLAYTVGGVLVQSWYSGTYSGTISVDATISYGGVDYPISTSGGATLVVDATGTGVTGDAECVLSLAGLYDLDLGFLIDATNTGGAVDGTAGVDLTWFTYDMDMTGTVTEDGVLTLSFSDEVMSIPISGTIDAERVSYDTSYGDGGRG